MERYLAHEKLEVMRLTKHVTSLSSCKSCVSAGNSVVFMSCVTGLLKRGALLSLGSSCIGSWSRSALFSLGILYGFAACVKTPYKNKLFDI